MTQKITPLSHYPLPMSELATEDTAMEVAERNSDESSQKKQAPSGELLFASQENKNNNIIEDEYQEEYENLNKQVTFIPFPTY